MVRKFAALLVILTLAVPTVGFSAPRDLTESVQALQSNGQTFCTAFSINEEEGHWGTAAHCAAHVLEKGLEVTIKGQPAWIVSISFPAADVAVFQSEFKAPAFQLASKNSEVGDDVYIIGYPYGITRTLTKGFLAAKSIPIQHPSTGYYMASDILDITTAGGNSGSPVFNAKGQVIGVLWGGFIDSPHSLAVPLDATRRAFQGFAE
jgi:serine protease Do